MDTDLIAALENMDKDEEPEHVAHPSTHTTAAQTGGVTGAGRVVRLGGSKVPAGLDAGTLLKRLRVTLPMVKAMDNYQAFNDLILNHLIAQNVRKGHSIVVPEDATVD